MVDFNLEEALQNLMIDPYPTKEFRSAMKVIKNFQTLLEQTQKSKQLNTVQVIEACPILSEMWIGGVKSVLLPSLQVKEVLQQKNIVLFMNSTLTDLLDFIVLKASKGENEDAESIVKDFQSILSFVSVYNNSFPFNKWLQDILEMFCDKLLSIKKDLNGRRADKLQVFTVIRILIVNMKEDLELGIILLERLRQEIKKHLSEIQALPPNTELEVWTNSYYFDCLWMIMSEDFLETTTSDHEQILSDLKNVLIEATAAENLPLLKQRDIRLIRKIMNAMNSSKNVEQKKKISFQ